MVVLLKCAEMDSDVQLLIFSKEKSNKKDS